MGFRSRGILYLGPVGEGKEIVRILELYFLICL